MLLSKLVYLCIKNVIYLNDSSFNYEAFLGGNFDSDPDYDTNINNVFSPLNEAIARLSDLERIPYKVEQVKLKKDTRYVETDNLTQETEENDKISINVKEVHAIGQFVQDKPKIIEFKQVGNKVFIVGDINSYLPIYIEYKEDIPHFSRDDIPEQYYSTENELDDDDVDLKEYGISDSMCNYIIEYVQGKLEEQIEPSLANMHITRAETYFNNIRTIRPLFLQRVVENKYKIGE